MTNNPTGGWKLCSCGKKYQGQCDHKPKKLKPSRIRQIYPPTPTPDSPLPNRCTGHGGFVYLLQAEGTDIYKIGKTKNLSQRLRDIGFISPLPVKLLGFRFCPTPHKKEESLHRHFAKQRLHGEWFRFTETDLASCLSLI